MAQVLGAKLGRPLKINEAPFGVEARMMTNRYHFVEQRGLGTGSGDTFAPGVDHRERIGWRPIPAR